MDRVILHVDVNNAFLSWTALYLLKKGHKYDIRKRYAVISYRTGGDPTAGYPIRQKERRFRVGVLSDP